MELLGKTQTIPRVWEMQVSVGNAMTRQLDGMCLTVMKERPRRAADIKLLTSQMIYRNRSILLKTRCLTALINPNIVQQEAVLTGNTSFSFRMSASFLCLTCPACLRILLGC